MRRNGKNDDKRQDNDIELLMKRVNSLQHQVEKIKDKKKSEKIDESQDYLEEK